MNIDILTHASPRHISPPSSCLYPPRQREINHSPKRSFFENPSSPSRKEGENNDMHLPGYIQTIDINRNKKFMIEIPANRPCSKWTNKNTKTICSSFFQVVNKRTRIMLTYFKPTFPFYILWKHQTPMISWCFQEA